MSTMYTPQATQLMGNMTIEREILPEKWEMSPEAIDRFKKLMNEILSESGMRTTHLAEKLQVSDMTIHRWKNGQITSLNDQMYFAIAPLTKYTPGQLLEYIHGINSADSPFGKNARLLDIYENLPTTEQLAFALGIIRQMPKTVSAMFIQKAVENLVD